MNAAQRVRVRNGKKKKKTATQKVVDSLQKEVTQCLLSDKALNESLIVSLTDFVHKSLESIKISKAFEGITFNSKYICTVLQLLTQAMAQSLIDLDAFHKRNTAHISLHGIITLLIRKNIKLNASVRNAIYKDHIITIKAEMEHMKDQPHIVKLMAIHEAIEQALSAHNHDSIGSALIQLHNDCKQGVIRINRNIIRRAFPMYECIQKLESSDKRLVVKKAKELLMEWQPYIDSHRGSRKRKERDTDSDTKQPPSKRSRRNCKQPAISDSSSESDDRDEIFNSDIYGNESDEDESSSGDERNERMLMRKKNEKKFMKSKEENRKRIEYEIDRKLKNKKTIKILDKFITAFEDNGMRNIMIWLTSLNRMSVHQLSIIKYDAKFTKYLNQLKQIKKYRDVSVQILQKL